MVLFSFKFIVQKKISCTFILPSDIFRWKYWLFANELQSFGTEMLVHKYIIFFGQIFEFTTIVLLPRASHPDTQMTEVISLRSNRAKDCPGKSNSFPQKFAKILTFTGVIYDFIQSISKYAEAIWQVLT